MEGSQTGGYGLYGTDPISSKFISDEVVEARQKYEAEKQ